MRICEYAKGRLPPEELHLPSVVVRDGLVLANLSFWPRDVQTSVVNPSNNTTTNQENKLPQMRRMGIKADPIPARSCSSRCEGAHRFHRSSSSPPQPQKALGKPLILRNCSTVSPLTPPKNSLYGRLRAQKRERNKRFNAPNKGGISLQTSPLSTEDSHVHIFVQFGSKMARHLPAAVVVAVVFRDVVHIVEDQAVPAQVLHGLQEAHVEQHGSVEGLAPALDHTTVGQRAPCCFPRTNDTGVALPLAASKRYLLDDVEGKLQPLPLQHGNQVLEEDGQMLVAVSERDQDGHLQHRGASEAAPGASGGLGSRSLTFQ